MTSGEFKDVSEDSRKGCFVVYLDIDRGSRKSFKRMIKMIPIKKKA
jgi:hypothetical protein